MVTEDAQRSALWLYYAISEHKNEKSESEKINTYETELSGEKKNLLRKLLWYLEQSNSIYLLIILYRAFKSEENK